LDPPILNLDCLLAWLAHRDDGYADNAEVAAPILDRLGLSATLFVATRVVGTQKRPPGMPGRPAEADGLESGRQAAPSRPRRRAHTVTHARVSAVRGSEPEREPQDSRRRPKSELGEPVRHLAYPFGGPGDCDFVARQAAQQAGYRCCLSRHGGLIAPTDSPFRLNRISISPRYHATPRA